MRGFLKTRFADHWLWLCPVLAVVLAAVVLMLFDFLGWLLLVCPALIVWGAIEVMLDERRQRVASRKNSNG